MVGDGTAFIRSVDDSTMSAAEVIHKGYLTKHGAVVKNWKLRFMVLLKNGKLLYFKKPPKSWETEEPKGVLNVQADVVELILWDESIDNGLVKWEKEAIPNSGFCLKTRQGRLWSLHAETVEACDVWIDSIRKVGANIRRSSVTENTLKQREELKTSEAAAAEAATKDADVSPTTETEASADGNGGGDAPPKYVHKVIGGMVVKVENTEWKYDK